ncbi:MAG: MBL fold metallo-hydrolase [Oscillospiraceae bacterium]|nr:MBL fold metallo-hydrolase [Oscillospiraceae bacterium]
MENQKKHAALRTLAACALGMGLSAALAWCYDSYVRWNPQAYPCAVVALCLGTILLTLAVLRARGERGAPALLWKSALSLAVFLALLIGVSYTLNNVMGKGEALAAWLSFPPCAAQILVLLALLLRGMAKDGLRAGALLAAAATLVSAPVTVFLLGRAPTADLYLTREGLAPYQPAPGRTAIHFINTGSGDAILLESNGKFALVDAAEDSDNPKNSPAEAYDGYERYVLDYVKRVAGGRLDFVLGTHAHSDHIGGFDTLLLDPDVTVGRAYLKRYDASHKNSTELGWDNQEVYDQMVAALAARQIPLIQDLPEEPFALGEFKITIFNGEFDPASRDENDNSLGVLAGAGGLRAFLAGDMNNLSGDEARLGPQIGQVDLLKAPHHGLEGSSTAKFVSALRPRTVVITTGPGGGNVNVLRRYHKLAQPGRIMCTGDFGGIVAVFGADGIEYYAIGEYPGGIGGADVTRK